MNANEKAAIRSIYQAGHPDSFGYAHVDEAVLAHELGVAQAELDVAREWLKRHMRRMDEMQAEASKLRLKKQRLIAEAQTRFPASAVVGLSISMDELSEKVRREHVRKLTTPDTGSAATQVTPASSEPAKQSRKKPSAPPDQVAATPEPQIPQPGYAGPFRIWPKSQAPSIELDRKQIDTLHSAYSADTIAARGSKTRKPVVINGTLYISVGGMSGGPSGRSEENGYELIPVADYPLNTYTYPNWSADGRKPPEVGYEGMIVTKGGTSEKVVLSRPVHFWHQDPQKIEPTVPTKPEPQPTVKDLLAKAVAYEQTGMLGSHASDPVIDDVDSLAEEAIYADTSRE